MKNFLNVIFLSNFYFKIVVSFVFVNIFIHNYGFFVVHFIFINFVILYIIIINANAQAEQRRKACEAASLMLCEVVQQAEKFSIVL